MKYLISTDLDGTLLDHSSYSWQAAIPALDLCGSRSIPIIVNTSKALAEVDSLTKQLGLLAPVVVENGSAMILPNEPSRAFKLAHQAVDPERQSALSTQVLADGRTQLRFGAERPTILSFIEQVRQNYGWQFEGFNDWSLEQICAHTGLTLEAAQLASQKYFSEPFIWNDSPDAFCKLSALAHENSLQILKGGRFFHLQGRTDKAKPLIWLLENLSLVFGLESKSRPKLICLGDNHNDVAMLNAADIPICVKSPNSDYPKLTTTRPVINTKGEGPIGWNEAIQQILN